MFQIFYQISPFFPDMHLPIPTGATRGCWGVNKHERRPAWPPVTAPTEKNKHVGSCLRISAWLVVKRCFWKYHEKETTTHNFLEWTYWGTSGNISRSSQLLSFFYLWVFFCFKKRVVVVRRDMRGDFRRCEGRGGWVLFWLAKRRKCLLKILGMDSMDQEKGGGIFQHFFWKCCIVETLSGRLCDGLQSLWRHLGGRLLFKKGCLNQFGVQKIKMQILILCNGKEL